MKVSNWLVFSLLVAPLTGVIGGCGLDLNELPSTGRPSPGTTEPQAPVEPDDSVEPDAPAEPTCTPSSCEGGCCLRGACYRTQSNFACGSMGAVCSTCQLLQSCQKEDVLRGWECLADRATHWSLQPLSASIPRSKPDGGSWDAGSDAPDVFVELECPAGGSVGKVKTAEVSSFTPSWTDGVCVTTSPELLNAPIGIKVLDVDFLSSEEILTTAYTLKEEDFAKGTVEVPISADGTQTLKLRLTRVQ